jgi:cytochrome bd-type quinol oxidase subunit 2
MVLVIAGLQASIFLRQRRQGIPLFHSTLEMFLVFALIAVIFFGMVVKSRQNRGNSGAGKPE